MEKPLVSFFTGNPVFAVFWFVAVIRVKSCYFPAVTVVRRTDKSNIFYEYLKEEAENPPLMCQIYFHYRNARGKGMITVLSTEIFDNRIDALKDIRAKIKIQARIRRLKMEIVAILSQQVKDFQKCGFMKVKATGFI